MAKKSVVPARPEEEQGAKHTPEVERLITKGREQGFVTPQEIAAAIGDAEENLEELDELYAALLENGVEITDKREALIWDADPEDEAIVAECNSVAMG